MDGTFEGHYAKGSRPVTQNKQYTVSLVRRSYDRDRREREQERMRLECTKPYREQNTNNWRCGRRGARKRREMSNRQNKYY